MWGIIGGVRKIDFLLLGTVVLITLFGLLMVYDASSYIAFRDFGNKYHFLQSQIFWVLIGFSAMGFFTFFDYHRLYNLAIPILVSALVLLSLVFVPGLGVSLLGARRWIDAKFFLIQPAEFAKLALAIYLAAWFSNKEKGRLLPFLLLLGLVLGLVMLEPDMGTAIVILGEAVALYFLSGGNILYLTFLAPVMAFLGFILIKIEPYRMARFTSFLNVDSSLANTSYHTRQILIALGSGGITGVGIGNSLQKYAYLPETTTDSIFAIVGEEFGFIGASLLVVSFMVLVLRGFTIAAHARDNFGKLLAGGLASFIAVQTIVNLGALTSLLPFTGIPLPFISYGGSSAIVSLSSIGILLNISRQRRIV